MRSPSRSRTPADRPEGPTQLQNPSVRTSRPMPRPARTSSCRNSAFPPVHRHNRWALRESMGPPSPSARKARVRSRSNGSTSIRAANWSSHNLRIASVTGSSDRTVSSIGTRPDTASSCTNAADPSSRCCASSTTSSSGTPEPGATNREMMPRSTSVRLVRSRTSGPTNLVRAPNGTERMAAVADTHSLVQPRAATARATARARCVLPTPAPPLSTTRRGADVTQARIVSSSAFRACDGHTCVTGSPHRHPHSL
jgi:hypothetical protein